MSKIRFAEWIDVLRFVTIHPEAASDAVKMMRGERPDVKITSHLQAEGTSQRFVVTPAMRREAELKCLNDPPPDD